MYRYYSLVFILLLFIFTPHGQDIKRLPEYERLYQAAEKLYSSQNATAFTDSIALGTYLKVIGLLNKEARYNETLADSYLKCGILQMSVNESAHALGSFQESIGAIGRNNYLPDSLLYKPYLYAGSIHYDLNDLDSALYYFNKAEAINSRYAALNETERLFNKLGALYYETGDYKKSINYFEKALSIVEERKPLNVFFIVNYKNNIATALLKSGSYKKALEIFTGMLPYHIAEDELFYNMANAYAEEGDYKSSLKFLWQIRQMELEKFNMLSKVFIRLKQYDSAQFYLTKAAGAFFNKKNNAKKVDYGITLKYSGDLEYAKGNAVKAISDYQLALGYLDPVFSDTAITSNPASFSGLQNFTLLFDALVAKALSFNALNNLQPGRHYLEQSLYAYTSALSLASHIERTYFSDDARLFLKQTVNPATQQAVDVAIRLCSLPEQVNYYMNIAFGFVENNKASVLQAGLQNFQLSAIPGLPAAQLAEEKNYKSLIAKLVIQSAKEKDSLSLSLLQKKIQDNEIGLARIQGKLDENALYHQLRFNTGLTNMDSIQNQVTTRDEAVLSYYYTAENLLCFYITKEGSGFSSRRIKNNFFSTIISLRKELENPAASSRKTLQEAGSILFQELVAPVLEKIKNKKRLVIIPYNEISYVPFEMMPEPGGGPLLLNRFAISYNYSVNFFANKKERLAANYNVLAMAPFSGKNTALILPSLPSSGDEISDLPGEKIYGAAANKMAFTTLSGQFPIIHLATHAVANDADPLGSYIEFYGLKNDADTVHRLYAPEIYNMDMKSARLIILSACETGNGLLVNGEGVISLSRAFSYAGCKSVITSLWKADDIATAFIVKRLHHYLQKGRATDEALQKAKIDYLNSDLIEARFKTPAYWAHLVLIGEHQPLVASGFQWYMLLALILPAALIFIILLKKNRA